MLVRASCINQGESGAAEDRFVNVMYFYNSDLSTLTQIASRLITRIGSFYGQFAPYLSNFLVNTLEVRFYNMADAPPRVPEIRTSTQLYGNPATNVLPDELSIVATLLPDPPITRRRRGRLYIGPLCADALLFTTTGPALVATPPMTAIANACTQMVADNDQAVWVVHSQTYGGHADITGGFVDNAFDIQRRRGVDATGRTQWGSAGGLRSSAEAGEPQFVPHRRQAYIPPA